MQNTGARRLRLPGEHLLADAAVAACAAVIAVAQQATSASQIPATRSLGLAIAALYPLALVVRGGRRSSSWPACSRDCSCDLETIGEAADGAAAVVLARLHRPDIVLMPGRIEMAGQRSDEGAGDRPDRRNTSAGCSG